MDYYATQFWIKLTRAGTNSSVLRHSGEVIQTRSTPKEGSTCKHRERFSIEQFRISPLLRTGLWSRTSTNLDEIGILDWEHRKIKKVIVPAAKFGQMIACVLAAGASLLPYIVTSPNSSTVQEHLKKQSGSFRQDFTLQFNQRPYVNAGILLGYIRTVFLSYIDAFHGLAVFAEEVAIYLMDHCSAHVSDYCDQYSH
jgi:hypothetical protein